jgi:hypothetical protein
MSGCALGLIALGVGYLVLIHAGREAGGIRTLGKIVGAVIMIASIAGMVCAAKCKMGGGSCPLTGKAMCAVKTVEVPAAAQ